MASNNVITDIESKNKATAHLNLSGVLFVIASMTVFFLLKDCVNIILQLPYFIFNFLCSVFLVWPSKFNKGRNNMESVFVLLRKDVYVYRPYILHEGEDHGSEQD